MQHTVPDSRGRQILKGVELRARHLLSTLEKETERHLKPWLRWFDFPSRREVQRLSRHIAALERQWRPDQSAQDASARRHTTARRRATIARPRGPIDSLRYAELFWDEA